MNDNWQVADILGTNINNGNSQVTVQIGDKASGKGFGASVPVWGIEGFLGCPNDPDDNGAAMALVFVDGNTQRVVASRDNRFTKLAGNMKAGDRMIVTNGAARFVLKQTGAVALITSTDGTDAGQTIYERVHPGGWEVVTPWGTISLGPLGFHLRLANGPRIDMGGIGGVPPPLDMIENYATISAGMVHVEGSAVSIGTDGGAASTAGITSLLSAITAIGTVLNALANTPAAVGTAPMASPAVSMAIGDLIAAVTELATAAYAIGRPA